MKITQRFVAFMYAQVHRALDGVRALRADAALARRASARAQSRGADRPSSARSTFRLARRRTRLGQPRHKGPARFATANTGSAPEARRQWWSAR